MARRPDTDSSSPPAPLHCLAIAECQCAVERPSLSVRQPGNMTDQRAHQLEQAGESEVGLRLDA
jgi:hypothetical protein